MARNRRSSRCSCVFVVGAVVGAGVVSPLADRYGRVKLLVGMALMSLLLGALTPLCGSEVAIGVLLFSSGLCILVYYPVCVVYLSEMVPMESVGRICGVFHQSLLFAGLVVIALYEVLESFESVALTLALFPSVLVLASDYVVNSPKFMWNKCRYFEARRSLRIIAHFNSSANCDLSLQSPRSPRTSRGEGNREERMYSFGEFMKVGSNRSFVVAFSGLAFSTSFAFGGTWLLACELQTASVGPGMEWWLCAIVLLALYVCIYRRERHKQRLMLCVIASTFLGFVSMLSSFHRTNSTLYTSLASCLTTLISSIGSFILAAESCPYRLRATGLGLVAVAGIVGGTLSCTFTAVDRYVHMWSCLFSFLSLLLLQKLQDPDFYLADTPSTADKRVNEKQSPGPFQEFRAAFMQNSSLVIRKISVLNGEGEDSNEVDAGYLRRNHSGPLERDSPSRSAREWSIDLVVSGTHSLRGVADPIGISSFCVSTEGRISGEGTNEVGHYNIVGQTQHNVFVAFTLQYEDGSKMEFAGERRVNKLQGQCGTGDETGSFVMEFSMGVWEGQFRKGGTQYDVCWLFEQRENTLILLGDENALSPVMHGTVDDHGTVEMDIKDAQGHKLLFCGTLYSDTITCECAAYDMAFELHLKPKKEQGNSPEAVELDEINGPSLLSYAI